jgi:hypothetical protein
MRSLFHSIKILFVFMLMVISCSGLRSWETCDTDGAVYQMLVEHHQEWVDYFATRPQGVERLETPNGITFRVENYPYVVRSLNTSTDGQPILLISTHEEYPGTFLGKAGYFYLPSGTFGYYYPELEIIQLSEHIYCYKKYR